MSGHDAKCPECGWVGSKQDSVGEGDENGSASGSFRSSRHGSGEGLRWAILL